MATMGVEGGEQDSKGYEDHATAPLLDSLEFKRWSFYRATMAEFFVTLLFLYTTLTTIVENKRSKGTCGGVGLLGEASAFRGMIFMLVYCMSTISGVRSEAHSCSLDQMQILVQILVRRSGSKLKAEGERQLSRVAFRVAFTS